MMSQTNVQCVSRNYKVSYKYWLVRGGTPFQKARPKNDTPVKRRKNGYKKISKKRCANHK